ncbi:MAG: hypothetical protein H0V19_06665, partial [Euzebyales bacterium]|nr:hypothetical protein [Euzebyales bacterium]
MARMLRRDQGSLRQLVTVLCVAAVLLPAAAGAATSPEAKLDEVTDELGEARSSLRRVEHQQQVQLADLEVIDARQTELQSQLRALNGRLDAAQAALDGAEHELAATTSELVAAGGRLQATRRRCSLASSTVP